MPISPVSSPWPVPSGTIPTPSDTNVFSPDQCGPNPYSDFKFDVSYEYITGVLQAPVADVSSGGAPIACEFIGVVAPYEAKVVRWTAEREGAEPKVPSPISTDPNCVLRSATRSPAVPVPMPNGLGFVYRISGVYVYGLVVPRGPIGDLPVGTMPVVTTPAVLGTFPGVNFDPTMLG